MCQMWQTHDTSHIRFPTASVVLHEPHVRTSQMPITASDKRRLAVPALRSASLRLVCWARHSDQPVAVKVAATAVTVSANPVICVLVAPPTPEEDRSHH
jgi:hypothetical protein